MSRLTPVEKVKTIAIRDKAIADNQDKKGKYKKAKKEAMLDSTARFMFNVFNTKSGNYSKEFEKLLIAGGGGNSMFVNCWAKPSRFFIKERISGKAKKVLLDNGYKNPEEAPHSFKVNNAKGSKNRIKKGKFIHLDHNPGNVKVLNLIKEKCMEFNPDSSGFNFEATIKAIKEYLLNIQTLDWITVEQDDKRTYGDKYHSTNEKAMMNKEERDKILNDIWEYL